MKLTKSSKVGVLFLVLGLGIFLAVAVWFETAREILADVDDSRLSRSMVP